MAGLPWARDIRQWQHPVRGGKNLEVGVRVGWVAGLPWARDIREWQHPYESGKNPEVGVRNG